MTQNLIAGQSTVTDAAALYGVTVQRVLSVLHESLTDVYTPKDGVGGVVTKAGRRYVWVNTRFGIEPHEASEVTLGADSITVLAKYLPGTRNAVVEPAAPATYVPTTELANGDRIQNYGMILRLTARREYPGDSEFQGVVVVFDGVVENFDEINKLADGGDDIARFIRGGVREDMNRKGDGVPVWRVQGNRLATWLRVSSARCGFENANGPCVKPVSPTSTSGSCETHELH